MNVAIKLSAANFYGTDASIKTQFFYSNFCFCEKYLSLLINCFCSVIHDADLFYING